MNLSGTGMQISDRYPWDILFLLCMSVWFRILRFYEGGLRGGKRTGFSTGLSGCSVQHGFTCRAQKAKKMGGGRDAYLKWFRSLIEVNVRWLENKYSPSLAA